MTNFKRIGEWLDRIEYRSYRRTAPPKIESLRVHPRFVRRVRVACFVALEVAP